MNDPFPLHLDCDQLTPVIVRDDNTSGGAGCISILPYGLPICSKETDLLLKGLDRGIKNGIEKIIEEDTLDLEMEYTGVPPTFDKDIPYILKPFDANLDDFQGQCLNEHIFEEYVYLESALNSTSNFRRGTRGGVRGDNHNHPLVPGSMVLYEQIRSNASGKEEQGDYCKPSSLELLCYSIRKDCLHNAYNDLSIIDRIKPCFEEEEVDEVKVEVLNEENSFYADDYNCIHDQEMKMHNTKPSIFLTTETVEEEEEMEKKEKTQEKRELDYSGLTDEEMSQMVTKILSVNTSNKEKSFVEDITNKNIKTGVDTQKEWALHDRTDMSHFRELVPHLAQEFPFELDDFQKRSIVHLERGENVYVCAHTSAGKTVVADYAISLCLSHKTKVVYTSPVKALSNQKYHDFKEKYEDVGIITGDVSMNPSASCLIMTTEILREMLYNGSDTIRDVEWVVFDEAHYINDSDRGVVWEESIILLPDNVHMAFLSATTPNVLDIADWIGRMKREKVYIMSTPFRPVPLEYIVYYDKKFVTIKDAEGNYYRDRMRVMHGYDGKITSKDNEGILPGYANFKASDISTVVKKLKERDDLPCIFFTMSKANCDKYASFVTEPLIDKASSKYIYSFFNQCIKKLRKEDRSLVQVKSLQQLVIRGVAVHHSGLLPLLKEIVEMLFSAGYIKVLFATETFAIGVNMPAKSVCFNGVSKFDGDGNRFFSPTEFTQMAGRSGRRGKDIKGNVYINLLKLPSVSALCNITGVSSESIQSKFRIDFSMILNIMRVQDMSIEGMLSRSFSESVRLRVLEQNQYEEKLREAEGIIVELKNRIHCDHQQDLHSFLTNTTELRTIQGKLLPLLISEYNKIDVGKKKKKEEVLKKGRFLKVDVSIPNKDGYDNVITTVAMIYVYYPATETALTLSFIPKTLASTLLNPLLCSYALNLPSLKGKILMINEYYLFVSVTSISDICYITKLSSNFDDESSRMTKSTSSTMLNPASAMLIAEEMSKYYDVIMKERNQMEFDFNRKAMNGWDIEELYSKSNELEAKLKIAKCPNCPKYNQCRNIEYVLSSMIDKREQFALALSGENLHMLPQLQASLAVLHALQYIDTEDTVTLKGRCGCYIRSGHELLIVEMVFENLMSDLTPPELAAAMSVMICERGSSTTVIKNRRLRDLVTKMKQISRRIAEVEKECGMDIDVDEEVEKEVKTTLMQITYDWVKGHTFSEIMQVADLDEGFVVNQLVRTEGVVKKLGDIAIEIGNPDLHYKCEEISQAMLRDIVFSPSLYLTMYSYLFQETISRNTIDIN